MAKHLRTLFYRPRTFDLCPIDQIPFNFELGSIAQRNLNRIQRTDDSRRPFSINRMPLNRLSQDENPLSVFYTKDHEIVFYRAKTFDIFDI